MPQKLDIEFVRDEFMRLKGYTLITDVYINNSTKMNYICPKHPNEDLWMSYGDLQRGRGCKFCANNVKLEIEFIKKEFLRLKGYVLLEEIYINANTRMKYQCPHHKDKDLWITYASLKNGNGCRFCANEGNMTSFLYNVGDIIETGNGQIKILEKYRKTSKKYYKYECLKCGYTSSKTENELKRKPTCSACYNPNRTYVGFNDIATTNKELEKLLLNKEDAYKYAQNSSKRVDFVCPFCNNIIYDKCIRSINKYGLSCNICGNGHMGGSFAERFMGSILNELNLKVKTQKTFNWSNSKRYDCYLTDYNIIIETHGLQHYEKTTFTKRTLKEEQENDKYKYDLAIKNGIDKYIVLDCRESTLEWIKNSILDSELNNLFDLCNIDWNKCHENAHRNIVTESWNLWNDGKTAKEIAKIIEKTECVVRNYLKIGHKVGKCDYNSEVNIRRETKKCICITTNEIFNSIKEACEYYHIVDVSACCRGKRNYCGIHPETGNPLMWEYYDNYLNMTKEQIDSKIKKLFDIKKVVCMNNKTIFNSAEEAIERYNLANIVSIHSCIRGINKTAGIDPITNERLVWEKYDEIRHKDFKLI